MNPPRGGFLYRGGAFSPKLGGFWLGVWGVISTRFGGFVTSFRGGFAGGVFFCTSGGWGFSLFGFFFSLLPIYYYKLMPQLEKQSSHAYLGEQQLDQESILGKNLAKLRMFEIWHGNKVGELLHLCRLKKFSSNLSYMFWPLKSKTQNN